MVSFSKSTVQRARSIKPASTGKTLFLLNLIFLNLISTCAFSQEITVSLLYPAENGGDRIYAVRFKNTSADSIMVLHAQESQLPPFINNYKWEKNTKTGHAPVTVYLGRSDNPFLPEQYRATKTLVPLEEVDLYFRLRGLDDESVKTMLVYYSMLSARYAHEFILLEKTGTSSASKRCKSLKQKHGIVHKRIISF